MKLGFVPSFTLLLSLTSCGNPATISMASRAPRSTNPEKIKKTEDQTPTSHQSPCGTFTSTPKLEAQIDLVAPSSEQKVASEIDGSASLPVTLFSRSKITCLEFLAEQEGSDTKAQWLKLPIDNFPQFAIIKTSLSLTEVGWNKVQVRAWTDAEPGAIVELPRVEVVARPPAEPPSPTPTPSSTAQPTPTPSPAPSPAPLPDPSPAPSPTPTPNPEATWKYSYYEGAFATYPDFAALKPVSTGSTWNLKMTEKGTRADNFAFVYEGESWANGDPISKIPQPFTFFLKCNDGCKLFINNFLIADNRSARGQEKSGTMNLSHQSIFSIRIEYFDSSGPENLEVNWAGPLFAKTPLKSDFLP